jgi:hypothetical protein
MRFCRTYLLQRGKALRVLAQYDPLVGSDAQMDERGEGKHADPDSDNEGSEQSNIPSSLGLARSGENHVPDYVTSTLQRVESLYVKLWLSLRYCVRAAFLSDNDVLAAGQKVMAHMDLVMRGATATAAQDGGKADDEAEAMPEELRQGLRDLDETFAMVGLGAVKLLPSEKLMVHIDCMNALGQTASIEDVDDMGGSCWVYIRVSVLGVALKTGPGRKDVSSGTVAVGDTFLFGTLTTQGLATPGVPGTSTTGPVALPLIGDGVCMTHGVPYYRCLVGAGAEETSAQRLLSCCRSTHYLGHLGLGTHLRTDASRPGSTLLSLPVLFDHPVLPVADAELRVFSEGLVIERMDCSSLPVLVSIGTHVDCMWVVDTAEVSHQASQLLPPRLSTFPEVPLEEGLLIVFRLKADFAADADAEAEDAESLSALQYNLLARALPFTLDRGAHEPRLLALVVKARSRHSQAMSSVIAEWKVALRRYGLQEHKGSDVPLPQPILRAFLTATDRLHGGYADTTVRDLAPSSSETVATTAKYCLENPGLHVPVVSHMALRCVALLGLILLSFFLLHGQLTRHTCVQMYFLA